MFVSKTIFRIVGQERPVPLRVAAILIFILTAVCFSDCCLSEATGSPATIAPANSVEKSHGPITSDPMEILWHYCRRLGFQFVDHLLDVWLFHVSSYPQHRRGFPRSGR